MANESQELINENTSLIFLKKNEGDILLKLLSDFFANNKEMILATDKKFQSKLKNVIKMLTIGVGAASGLPWLESAKMAGGSNLSFGYSIATSMLIAYGATTIWAGFDITNAVIQVIPNGYKEYQETKIRRSHFLEHGFYHLLGALTTIPGMYMTIVFNDTDHSYLYVPLVGVVSYIFHTFGLYKLIGEITVPTIKSLRDKYLLKVRENEVISERANFDAIITYLERIISSGNKLKQIEDIVSDNLSMKDLARLLYIAQQNSQEVDRNASIRKTVFYSLVLPLDLIAPTMNSVISGIMTYNALKSVFSSDVVCYTVMPFIVVPIYGLDLYSIHNATKNITNGMIDYFRPSLTSATKNLQWKSFILPTLAIAVSIISCLNDRYVGKEQVEHSELSNYAQVFATSLYLTKVCLEALGFYDVLKRGSMLVAAQINPKVKATKDALTHLSFIKTVTAGMRIGFFSKFNLNLIPEEGSEADTENFKEIKSVSTQESYRQILNARFGEIKNRKQKPKIKEIIDHDTEYELEDENNRKPYKHTENKKFKCGIM